MSSRKIWDYWAKYYDRLWVQKYSLGPTRKAVRDLLSKYADGHEMKLLDVGCGPGELLEEIKKQKGEQFLYLAGIDYAPKMLDLARKKLPESDFFLRDIEALTSIGQTFDIIVCTHSLPYYKDQQVAISDMASMLKDNGILIIGCGSVNTFYDKLVFSLVKLTTGLAKYPSADRLKEMTQKEFEMLEMVYIREKWYMPSIITVAFRKSESR